MDKWKDKRVYNHIKVPVDMGNHVVSHNIESPFRLFVYLKIKYPSGKLKWDIKEKKMAALDLKNNIKTVKSNFSKIIDLGWVEYIDKFDYWRLNSFEKIRGYNNWEQRRSFCFTYEHLNDIQAVLGGILYAQLYKHFLRKYLRGNSHVLIKRSADKSIASFISIKKYAEISVKGICINFGLSNGKALRLKKRASKAGYIKVRKQYVDFNQEMVDVYKINAKYSNQPSNIIYINGKYCLQLTDKIHTDITFKKRGKIR